MHAHPLIMGLLRRKLLLQQYVLLHRVGLRLRRSGGLRLGLCNSSSLRLLRRHY